MDIHEIPAVGSGDPALYAVASPERAAREWRLLS
jgi:hypothetical protein